MAHLLEIGDLPTRFRAARRLAEVSAIDAADQLGISRATLHRIEKGESPLKPLYIKWAITEWNAPTWLLPVDEGDLVDQASPARQLADLARHELDRDARENPPAEGSGADTG